MHFSVVCILYFFLESRMARANDHHFHRNKYFDNKTCLSEDTLFVQPTASRLACISVCSMDSTCRSLFFNMELKICHSCNRTYWSLESLKNESGYQMYTTCEPILTDMKKLCPSCYRCFLGKNYYFSVDQKNWTDAQEKCHSMNGYLVEIYDNETNDFLQQNAEGVHVFAIKQT